jgi:hypothetical protein
MTAYTTLPTYDQTLTTGKNPTNKVWYFFFKSLYVGSPPAAEFAVSLTASPFSFVAPQRGFLIVQGGSVVLVQFSRNGKTNYTTGQTQGVFPVSANDTIIIRYSVAPTVTFVPQ